MAWEARRRDHKSNALKLLCCSVVKISGNILEVRFHNVEARAKQVLPLHLLGICKSKYAACGSSSHYIIFSGVRDTNISPCHFSPVVSVVLPSHQEPLIPLLTRSDNKTRNARWLTLCFPSGDGAFISVHHTVSICSTLRNESSRYLFLFCTAFLFEGRREYPILCFAISQFWKLVRGYSTYTAGNVAC